MMERSMGKAMRLFLIMRELEAGKEVTALYLSRKYGIHKRTAARHMVELATVLPLEVRDVTKTPRWALVPEMRR